MTYLGFLYYFELLLLTFAVSVYFQVFEVLPIAVSVLDFLSSMLCRSVSHNICPIQLFQHMKTYFLYKINMKTNPHVIRITYTMRCHSVPTFSRGSAQSEIVF